MTKELIMDQKSNKDILIIGFALFSMFFGAGNLIFPPYLGLTAAPHWMTALISYYIADIGIAVLAILALLKSNGDIAGITGKLGNVPGKLMTSAIILCIGPLLAIPRTAAVTYEMGILPLIDGSYITAIITSIVFFGIVFALSVKESAVVDIVGKLLTPALLLGLTVLITKGFMSPIGQVSDTAMINNVVATGITSGYQTMDVLAALAFGLIIIKTVEQKGYTDQKRKFRIVAISSIIAAFWLFVVYAGLTYLGATSSTLYDAQIGRGELIVAIIRHILGNSGVILLGIVVALACITTAIALVSASANYFSQLSGGKISYTMICFIVCLFSMIFSNIGLDTIIAIAFPILSFVYPGALTLIILSFFSGSIHNQSVYLTATSGAMLVSLLEILYSYGVPVGFVTQLPLAEFGFAWVLPAFATGLLGLFFKSNEIYCKMKLGNLHDRE